ncbi:MAG: hypothetical protein C5B55_09615 [Blastocatellia bacterium]|nr:MAG: hypothetical protein C5B55_09615 [Blastocatellia bacterium]
MEELFKQVASWIALAVEMAAALLIAYGALEAIISLLIPRRRFEKANLFHKRRQIFLRFGVWLLLGLEFELAADIVRSAISPTWSDIGQLGAIAAIRTVLNYFLERDVSEFGETVKEGAPTEA